MLVLVHGEHYREDVREVQLLILVHVDGYVLGVPLHS